MGMAWPLEMLRIKGALKGGELSRNPKGLPIESGTPLTASFPSLFEALGLNYHHLDVNIGKIIVPGPTIGRDYAVFEAIAAANRAAAFSSAKNKLCSHTMESLATTNLDSNSDSQESPSSEDETVEMGPRKRSLPTIGPMCGA